MSPDRPSGRRMKEKFPAKQLKQEKKEDFNPD